jgi:hypothetical protein
MIPSLIIVTALTRRVLDGPGFPGYGPQARHVTRKGYLRTSVNIRTVSLLSPLALDPRI